MVLPCCVAYAPDDAQRGISSDPGGLETPSHRFHEPQSAPSLTPIIGDPTNIVLRDITPPIQLLVQV